MWSFTLTAPLLAAHASEVWVNPLGGAVIAGPGGERLYYAGLLDKLKVNARVYKVGEYKSAVEPYSRADMSDAARENARALYETLWEEYRANLKKARPGADIARVTDAPVEWIQSANGDLATAALQAALLESAPPQQSEEERQIAEAIRLSALEAAPEEVLMTDAAATGARRLNRRRGSSDPDERMTSGSGSRKTD